MTTTILKSLVGSRAHGLHREDSDYDWRGVYVQPTTEILALGYKYTGTQWFEGAEDNTNYEIGHFLSLATHANPSVLEVLTSPTMPIKTSWGEELIDLMPYMFTPKAAFNAFSGYSLNQRKKFLDDKNKRRLKFALAYIRTLYNLNDLLRTGTFSLHVEQNKYRYKILTEIRDNKFKDGEIIDIAKELTVAAEDYLPSAIDKSDPARINDFLMRIRKAAWEGLV